MPCWLRGTLLEVRSGRTGGVIHTSSVVTSFGTTEVYIGDWNGWPASPPRGSVRHALVATSDVRSSHARHAVRSAATQQRTMQHSGDPPGRPSRATCLALALVVTVAARAVPDWPYLQVAYVRSQGGSVAGQSMDLFANLVLLVMAALLCLSAPLRSGLRIGAIREHWRGVLIVCGGPIVLAAIVYPNLTERPFAGAGASMYTVSPLAQELLFAGFLYGHLERAFPGHLHARLRLRKAVPLTAVFFAIWHLPNFGSDMSAGFVAFQLIYTGLGALVGGLARQWTGSMIYGLVPHCVNNWIAVVCS